MASGTITLSRSGSGYLSGRITWNSTSNGTSANTSTVTARVQIQRSASNTTTGTFTGSFKVGGTSKSISEHLSLTNSWVTLKTITVTVNHNTDGTGTCYLYAKIKGPGGTSMEGTSVSGSATVTLDTIPRQAVMTSATDFTDETNPTITYTNPIGAAVPSLQVGISLDGTSNCAISYRDVDKTAGTDVIELTEAERDILRAATPASADSENKNARVVWIYLRTRIDETYYYSPISKTFTIKNPNPVISPTIVDSNTTTVALTGDSNKLVRYYSNAKITIGATAVKKATISSKKVTCGDKSLTADGTINAVETNNFNFTATDNRGNTTTLHVTAPFIEYVKLTCNLSNNMPDTEGDMTVSASGNYFNGSFGTKSNTLKVYYRYKTANGSYGNWVAMSTSFNGNSYSATASLSGLDYQTTYTFQAYAVDAIATTPNSERVVKAEPVFDWGENDFRFNVPVYLKDKEIRAKRCVVGNNSSSDTNPWYKYASISASAVNEDLRISFKITYSYGSNTRFGVLNAMIRTENASGANAFQRLEFESDTGLDSSNFVMVYNNTGVGGTYELWVKLSAYRFCMLEVLSESSRIAYINKWTLYDQISAGYASGPTSGYTQVAATKPYLLNSYPVGSYYISADTTSPASLFGGTWTRIESRFLWASPSDDNVKSGATGGVMDVTLTVDQIPAHKHSIIRPKWYAGDGNGTVSDLHSDSTIYAVTSTTSKQYISKTTSNTDIQSTGGGESHTNMPPYVCVAIWKRTA